VSDVNLTCVLAVSFALAELHLLEHELELADEDIVVWPLLALEWCLDVFCEIVVKWKAISESLPGQQKFVLILYVLDL